MSDYRKVADGTDADGRAWEIGVSGAHVLLSISLIGGMFATGRLNLGPADRDHLVRSYMEAERIADETGEARSVSNAFVAAGQVAS